MEPTKNETAAGTVERLALNKRDARLALGGVSETTLWRLEQRGLITSIPGLRHKLYSVESLKRFVSGRAA